MNHKSYYVLLTLLCIHADTVSMMQPVAGSAAVLHELMQTIARRKRERHIKNGVTARRTAIAESSDSESDVDPSATIHHAMIAPTSSPIIPPSKPMDQTTQLSPSSSDTAPLCSSSPSDSDSDSDDESGYTSELSDIEDALPADVHQMPYSTGLLGTNITTPAGFISHFETQMAAQKHLDAQYQHSASQHLNTALIAVAQILTAHIAEQKDIDNLAARLAALENMRLCVIQLNQLKALASYHNLITDPPSLAKAETAAREYKRHIIATERLAIAAVREKKVLLSNQWGAGHTLSRAAQLKKDRVGKANNTAALDVLTQKIAADLCLVANGDTALSAADLVTQAHRLIKTFHRKRVPLNPHSVKELLDALLALEANIAEQREADKTAAIVDQYGIEQAIAKLSAYVEQEAAAHSQQLGASASASACPVADDRDK